MTDTAQPQGSALDLESGDVSGVDVVALDVAAIDATAVDPVVFANMVRTASDEQLEAALAAARETILDEVFRRMQEHFDAEKAAGVDIVVQWKLSGRPSGGDHDLYQLTICGGACVTQRGSADAPLVTLELSAPSFLRLATGNIHGAALYLSGGLKIEGDVAQALTVQTYFRIPEPTMPAEGSSR